MAGHQWDAIVDVTRQPAHAREACAALAADHWVYVSSASVYARNDLPGRTEEAEVLPPLASDRLADPADYGAAKVACEQAVLAGTASSTVVRAGLIGGAEDWSGRSGYYPWRFAHPTGDDVLVPDDPELPTALIDVEDLAAWLVHCASGRVRGIFNATGPTTTLGNVIDLSRRVACSAATARPVTASDLRAAGVGEWMGPRSLPLWLSDPDWRWTATLDCTAARTHGLLTRPLEATLRAALAFEEARQGERGSGLTDAEERELRATLDS